MVTSQAEAGIQNSAELPAQDPLEGRPFTIAVFDPKGTNPVRELAFTGAGCLGFILCFTIIGAVIGIPMIIADMAKKRTGAYGGTCPHCSTELTIYGDQPGVDCKACKKRVVRRDEKFIAV